MFFIEDEIHAEQMPGEFTSFDDALSELKRLSVLPWDSEPNQAPCTGWQTCGREYVVIDYDDSVSPPREKSRISVLNVSADKVVWLHGAAGR